MRIVQAQPEDVGAELRAHLPGAFLELLASLFDKQALRDGEKRHPGAVYRLDAQFGERVIDDGRIRFEAMNVDGSDTEGLIWSNRLRVSDASLPVAIVLQGSFEVHQPDIQNPYKGGYKKPTTVLYPGELLGLWENFSDHSSPFKLFAGCQSFLAPYSMGDEARWKNAKHPTQNEVHENLKWVDGSRLRYSSIATPGLDVWAGKLLLLDCPWDDELIATHFQAYQWLLEQTIEQYAMAADRDMIGEARSNALVAKNIEQLVRSAAKERATGYYMIAGPGQVTKGANEDFPVEFYHKRFQAFKDTDYTKPSRTAASDPEKRRFVPLFVPCRICSRTVGRSQGRFYRLIEICRALDSDPKLKQLPHYLHAACPGEGGLPLNSYSKVLSAVPREHSRLQNAFPNEQVGRGWKELSLPLDGGTILPGAERALIRFFHSRRVKPPTGADPQLDLTRGRFQLLAGTYPEGSPERNADLDIRQSLDWIMQIEFQLP